MQTRIHNPFGPPASHPARPMARLLTHSSQQQLAYILKKAEQINQTQAAILEILPAPLRAHCQVIDIDEGTLVMRVHNASIATQLRFEGPAIIRALNQKQITRIACKVRPY